MDNLFFVAIDKINNSFTPIQTAWHISCKYLQIEHLISDKFSTALFKNIDQLNNLNSYHDQFHLAEVLYISAYLLKHEFKTQKEIEQHSLPLMISSLFHDAKHLGRSNQTPYELELQSIAFFKNYFHQNQLNLLWDQQPYVVNQFIVNSQQLNDIVTDLITATEFKVESNKTSKAYLEQKNKHFDVDSSISINRLKLLLIESDILLSVLPKTGLIQTKKILTENKVSFNIPFLIHSWAKFLEHVQTTHYLSDGANYLNVAINLEKTLQVIKKTDISTFKNINEFSNYLKIQLES